MAAQYLLANCNIKGCTNASFIYAWFRNFICCAYMRELKKGQVTRVSTRYQTTPYILIFSITSMRFSRVPNNSLLPFFSRFPIFCFFSFLFFCLIFFFSRVPLKFFGQKMARSTYLEFKKKKKMELIEKNEIHTKLFNIEAKTQGSDNNFPLGT